VMTDIESASKSVLYWRSLTHWLGGMGIIVLFIAILPQLGVGARHLFKSEVPGPITEGLKPKLKQTSAALWKLYIGLTGALLVCLMLAGVDLYDALCHALTCMATGGFSTKNASIAHYDSVSIDIIITIFMAFAGINFGLYYALARGRVREMFSNPEFKVYIAINVVAMLLIAVSILGRHPDFFTALRYASFQTLAVSQIPSSLQHAQMATDGRSIVSIVCEDTDGGSDVCRWYGWLDSRWDQDIANHDTRQSCLQ